jgi:hypothetical protein
LEKFVFNYRSGMMYVVIVFLLVWSGGWLTGVVTSFNSLDVKINGRLASPEEARPFLMLMAAIGLLGLTGAMALIGYVWNTRVEIENGEIRQYDLLGRERARGWLKTATIQAVDATHAKIETDGGTIKVSTNISNYGVLKTMVEDGAPIVESRRFAPSSYIPQVQTIGARWGQLHLFSFVWLGMIFYIASGSKSAGGNISPVFFLAMLPGIVMQLVGWFEKVQIGPDGVKSTDLFGRPKVQAGLDEIVGADWAGGSKSRTVQIHTLRGTISIGNYYWGQQKAFDEVQKVVASR